MTSRPCVVTSVIVLVAGCLYAVCVASWLRAPKWSLHDSQLTTSIASASLHDANAARRYNPGRAICCGMCTLHDICSVTSLPIGIQNGLPQFRSMPCSTLLTWLDLNLWRRYLPCHFAVGSDIQDQLLQLFHAQKLRRWLQLADKMFSDCT